MNTAVIDDEADIPTNSHKHLLTSHQGECMKILLVHLSDIHFKDALNPIVDKADNIAAVIRSAEPSAAACFIVVTGDIAFSGEAEQYEIASNFFLKLRTSISQEWGVPILDYVFVPGNHDCNFQKASQVRQVIIENVSSSVEKLERDNSILKTCLAPQEYFFKFLSVISEEPHLSDGVEQLYYEKEFLVGKRKLRFNCYNTAWMSQINEHQGSLFFPTDIIKVSQDKCDLILSAFHHPYNWLEADNSRIFRRHVERTSDIVLTGHEHNSYYYEKLTISGDVPHYTEGAVLQDAGDDVSGFNIILVDVERSEHKVVQYSWNGELYVSDQETPWNEFRRNPKLKNRGFENDAHFLTYLSDVGANFNHPLIVTLSLRDVFVYPDMEVYEYGKNVANGEYVYGEKLLEYVIEHPHCLFLGSDLSGKTSLAKTLYIDLQKRGLVPLLIDGAVLKNCHEDDFIRIAQRAFESQYDSKSIETYKQLESKFKVLIIRRYKK